MDENPYQSSPAELVTRTRNKATESEGKMPWWFVWTPFLLILILCSGALYYSRPEKIASIRLAETHVASVFAEGPFHYEPPGYLSIEIRDQTRKVVPRYSFVGIGTERVPNVPFGVAESDDGSIIALTQSNDIVFMFNLESEECCPPPGWSIVDFAPHLAERLLASFASRPELTCSRLERFKRYASVLEMRGKRMHAEAAAKPVSEEESSPSAR